MVAIAGGFLPSYGLFSEIFRNRKDSRTLVHIIACSKFKLKSSCNLGFILFLFFAHFNYLGSRNNAIWLGHPLAHVPWVQRQQCGELFQEQLLSWMLLLWAIWKIFANNQFLHKSQYWFVDSKISYICQLIYSQIFQPKLVFLNKDNICVNRYGFALELESFISHYLNQQLS